jgi:hypothetical protein
MYCLTFHRRASPRSTRRRRTWSGRWRATAGEALVVAFTQGCWLSFAIPAAAAVPVAVTYGVGRLWVEQRAVERFASETEMLRRFQGPGLLALLPRTRSSWRSRCANRPRSCPWTSPASPA